MRSNNKLYTVDRFLGLNESADGNTELKMGEASRMENFTVTDGMNLKTRPGIRRVLEGADLSAPITASWAGRIGDTDIFIVYYRLAGDGIGERYDMVSVYTPTENGGFTRVREQTIRKVSKTEGDAIVKFFTFGGDLYLMSDFGVYRYDAKDGFAELEPYIPKVVIGASPAGGGTKLEDINTLSWFRRIEYNADGESTAYVLPSEATNINKIKIDNVEYTPPSGSWEIGVFDNDTKTFTFSTAPQKGVGNVEITYVSVGTFGDLQAWYAARQRILEARLWETYNGSTDTRLFVAGNGTNVCYYTGVTEAGKPDPTYFPAMNEIMVDMDSTEITGLQRHFTKLLVFTRAGAYTITYEPVTLVDGSTIAGFYLRAANRDFGNEAMGQVQTVNNYPRTVTSGGICEWKITSSFYRDERYAKIISQRVEKALKKADVNRIITCDDNYRKEYYVFLNDEEGTVLVNRYGLSGDEIWVVYKSIHCRNVTSAAMCGNIMVFTTESEMFFFDEEKVTDAGEKWSDEDTGIPCLWESGMQDFGAGFRRKYSSTLYVSMLPEENSELIVTAETDRRDDYPEKVAEFEETATARIRRIRLKTKKFVYYKLILRVDTPGKQATVLGYDQEVTFSSMAK